VSDLERELDQLYGLPPDEFTRARNELAARLKSDGDSESAASVKALKKPTVPAALVNQLARRESKLVQRLLEAGDALKRAQADALRGGGAAELHHAAANVRDTIRELVQAAQQGRGAVSQAVLDRVRTTLDAAAVDDDARAALEAGRVTKEYQRVGFPAFDAAATTLAAKTDRPAVARDELAERRKQREEQRERVRALRERLQDLRREAARAEQEARRAEQEAETARAEADRAARESAELMAELERTEAELAEAEHVRDRRV
jgi:hypothetical protein